MPTWDSCDFRLRRHRRTKDQCWLGFCRNGVAIKLTFPGRFLGQIEFVLGPGN